MNLVVLHSDGTTEQIGIVQIAPQINSWIITKLRKIMVNALTFDYQNGIITVYA